MQGVDLKDRNTQLAIVGTTAGLLGAVYLYRSTVKNRLRYGSLTPDTLAKDDYDAIIVGAGTLIDIKRTSFLSRDLHHLVHFSVHACADEQHIPTWYTSSSHQTFSNVSTYRSKRRSVRILSRKGRGAGSFAR